VFDDFLRAGVPKIWVEEPATRPAASFQNVALFLDVPLTGVASLADQIPTPVVHVPDDPPDYFQCGPLHVMSAALIALLRAAVQVGRDVEFLPLDVRVPSRRGPYFFGHVLDVVDCIDRSRSRFTEANGIVDRIDHLELSNAAAHGHRLFRIGSTYEYLVCVDDDLAGKIFRETTGSRFVKPEEWRW
jgi:hypothetical protein